MLKPLKDFLPRTLFGRSLLILVAPIFLIQIITSVIFFDRHWDRMTDRLALAVSGEVAVMARALEQDEMALSELAPHYADRLDMITRFSNDERLTAQGLRQHGSRIWEEVVGEKLEEQMQKSLERPFFLNMNFEEKWIEVSVQLTNGVLVMTFPERRFFSSSGYVFLLWVFSVSSILLVVAVLFMRNQIRPIRKLAVAAELFGKGRDVPSFRPSGAREVRQAASAFMAMRERIGRQIEQRTAMLAGVSHDLRTPLTRLKLQLEMMGEDNDIAAMKEDITQMERMINGYLDFARGEEGEKFQAVTLQEMLDQLVISAKRQGVDIRFVRPDNAVMVMVRPIAFERALNNLTNNAAKYADHVWLSLDVNDENIVITVEDDGPGIAPDMYDEVFKPFTRVDESRNSETGGVGLGLPIAQDIIHAHGGTITLGKSAHGGLKVLVNLPR